MMPGNTILVLNGPGLADPSGIDSDLTLQSIEDECVNLATDLHLVLDFRQTDDEEELARWITGDSKGFAALIVNPVDHSAATSDDLRAVRAAIGDLAHFDGPVIEVRLENIFRDDADCARPLRAPDSKMGLVCGLGMHGYLLGIRAAEQAMRD